jgi:hypothetical protein
MNNKTNALLVLITVMINALPVSAQQFSILKENGELDVEYAVEVSNLMLATDLIGSVICDISIAMPASTPADKKQRFIELITADTHKEELAIVYQETKLTEERTKLIGMYLDKYCKSEFLNADWGLNLK